MKKRPETHQLALGVKGGERSVSSGTSVLQGIEIDLAGEHGRRGRRVHHSSGSIGAGLGTLQQCGKEEFSKIEMPW